MDPICEELFVFQFSAGVMIIHSLVERGADRRGGETDAAGTEPTRAEGGEKLVPLAPGAVDALATADAADAERRSRHEATEQRRGLRGRKLGVDQSASASLFSVEKTPPIADDVEARRAE